MGRLFVIEGLDGSGKATQAGLLYDRLHKEVKEVSRLDFPCYEEDSSLFVRMYLDGQFGDKPGDVNAYAASMFYAADRYVSYKKSWGKAYQEGGIFLADRYATSNEVYQMSKLPKAEWDEFLSWLTDFEYEKLGIPAPDLVIYIDIPPAISAELMMIRYGGDKSKMDIHEKDIEFQKKCRAAALYCAEKEGWRVIDCSVGGKMRAKDSIAEEIFAKVAEHI